MIWRSSFNSRLAQTADFLTVCMGFFISFLIWSCLHTQLRGVVSQPANFNIHFLSFIVFSGLVFVLLMQAYKAYSFQRFTSLTTEYSVVLRVSVIGILLSIAIAFFANLISLRRTFFLVSFFVILLLLILEKTLLFYAARFVRKRGYNRRRVIVVGAGKQSQQFIEKVRSNFGWGLDIVGLLTDDPNKIGTNCCGIPVLGHYNQVIDIIKEYNPEEVVIALSSKDFGQIREIVEVCEKVGIQIRLNSDFFGYVARNVRVDQVMGLNIISFDYIRQSEFELFCKRCMDIIISFILIVLLSPLFAVIAVTILIKDGSPVLYQWKVMGKNRKPITSWKFRTMVKNADEIKEKLLKQNEMEGPVFKMSNDPRVLPFGRFLRKYSLDELPQLFSVLKGDLSLVGPRPPLQKEFREFDLWHCRKLMVKPGLTCLWQISGRNGIRNLDDWVKLDLAYINNWSLWLDFKILFQTVGIVLKGTGK